MKYIRFIARNQQAGETIDEYVIELRILEKTREFGSLGDYREIGLWS